MPPQARSQSPAAFMASVHGEWSETTRSRICSRRPAQSSSRLAASRTGGEHLAVVSAISSAVRVR